MVAAPQQAQEGGTAPQQAHAPTGKPGNCQWFSKNRSPAEIVDLFQPGAEPDSSSQKLAAESLRYFNWDQRATARAAMQTLVTALSDDPINSYFTGSIKRQKKFVKDEVGSYMHSVEPFHECALCLICASQMPLGPACRDPSSSRTGLM